MVDRPPIQPNSIYSRQDVAVLLGVSLSTTKRLIASGQLVVSRPNGVRRVFIRGASILKMLEETQVGRYRDGPLPTGSDP